MWQEVIPRIAFQNKFLLHGILAFTTLHLKYLQPDRAEELLAQALVYRDTGLALFRLAIANLTKENYDACFSFSSLLVGCTWASSAGIGDLFFSDPLENAGNQTKVGWVSLLRGAYSVLDCSRHWMADSPLQPNLRLTNNEQDIPSQHSSSLSSRDKERFMKLKRLWEIPQAEMSDEQIVAMNETWNLLQESYAQVTSQNASRAGVDEVAATLSWPAKAPETYITMVNRRIPEALVLLAHYCLVLNTVDHYWWIRGMSKSLLRTIHKALGREWENWIAWPLQDLVVREFNSDDAARTEV